MVSRSMGRYTSPLHDEGRSACQEGVTIQAERGESSRPSLPRECLHEQLAQSQRKRYPMSTKPADDQHSRHIRDPINDRQNIGGNGHDSRPTESDWWQDQMWEEPGNNPLPGHVYLCRGLILTNPDIAPRRCCSAFSQEDGAVVALLPIFPGRRERDQHAGREDRRDGCGGKDLASSRRDQVSQLREQFTPQNRNSSCRRNIATPLADDRFRYGMLPSWQQAVYLPPRNASGMFTPFPARQGVR